MCKKSKNREQKPSKKKVKRTLRELKAEKRENQEAKRLRRLEKEGRLVNGVEMPRGAIAADISKQAPNNSYDVPPSYYVDVEFTCIDCGVEEVWKAKQQKWYYEVAKGSVFATAIRCRKCRKILQAQKAEQAQRMKDTERDK